MIYHQSRWLPAVVTAAFGLLAAAMLAGTVQGFARPAFRSQDLLPLGLLLLGDVVMAGLAAFYATVLIRPARLAIAADGFDCKSPFRSYRSSWAQTSNFRIGPRGGAILFDVAGPVRTHIAAIPAGWSGGTPAMVARLNAARSQYADPAWNGVDWKDAPKPKTHDGLQFAAGLALGLVFCFGLVMLELHGAHHR